ncbi:MAG: Ig-like domain-containing protein [Treponemataceae bacterium]
MKHILYLCVLFLFFSCDTSFQGGSLAIAGGDIISLDDSMSSYQITFAQRPAGTLQYESNNPSVATVDSKGLVSILQQGTVEITIRRRQNCQQKLVESKVTIIISKALKSLNVIPSEVLITIGSSVFLEATVEPSDTANKTVSWHSENEAIAKVSQEGEVTAIAEGSVIITATAHEGKISRTSLVTATTQVFPMTGIKLPDSIDIALGTTREISATIVPLNAINKTVMWDIEDTTIATLSSENNSVQGKPTKTITGVTEGSTKITVTSENGEFSTECIVNVIIIAVTDIIIPANIDVFIGETKEISATAMPENATYKKLDWGSPDESIALFDKETGFVTGVKDGSTKIPVTSEKGEFSSECTINVLFLPVTDIIIPASIDLRVGETKEITADVVPENATYKKLNWGNPDKSIALFDKETGIITGVTEGSTKITVTSEKEEFSTECTINVVPAKIMVESVALNSGEKGFAVVTTEPQGVVLSWESLDQNIATVDTNTGEIKAFSGGTARLKVSTKGVTEEFEVKVTGLEYTLNSGTYAASDIGTYTDPHLIILDELHGVPVTTIASRAFQENQTITKVTINKNIKTIGSSAFYDDTNLKDVYIDSQAIVELMDNETHLFSAAETVYVKEGITPSSTSYIIEKFSDKGELANGYVPYKQKIIITLSKASTTIVVGGTEQIKPHVVPESESSKVRWETDDKSIVTVDPISGLMTGISDGVATVTAKILGTNVMASCDVTVFDWSNREGAFVITEIAYQIVIDKDGRAKDKNGVLVNVETLHYKFPSGVTEKTFYIENDSEVERNVFISFENTSVDENNAWASGLRIYGKGTKKLTAHIRLTGTNAIVAGKEAGPWHGIHLEGGNKDVDIIFYANGKSSLSMKGNDGKSAIGVGDSTSSITLKGSTQTKITSFEIPTFPRKVTTTKPIFQREIVINVEE